MLIKPTLDGCRRTLEAERFNDVGVECSLEEPLDLSGVGSVLGSLFDSDGLLLEKVNESVTNHSSLSLGLGETLETAEEKILSLENGQVDAEMLLKCLLHLLALVEAHDTVVDKNGMESIT